MLCRYTGTLGFNIEGEWVVDAGNGYGIDGSTMPQEAGRWCNHKCVPNAKFVIYTCTTVDGEEHDIIYDNTERTHYVTVEAIDVIEGGFEIFVDYGKSYFTNEQTGEVDQIYWYGSPQLIEI